MTEAFLHEHDAPLWTPSPERVAESAVSAFINQVETTVGRPIPDYPALHAWSLAESEAFWRMVWQFGRVIGDRGIAALVDGHLMPGARWFPDARLNFAENLLRDSANPDAIVFRGEDKVE